MFRINNFNLTLLKRFQSTKQIIYENKPQLGFYRGFSALMTLQGLFWFQYSYYVYNHKENANKVLLDLYKSRFSEFFDWLHKYEIVREISMQKDLRMTHTKQPATSEPEEGGNSEMNKSLYSPALPYVMFTLGCLTLIVGCVIPTRAINRISVCRNNSPMGNSVKKVRESMAPLVQLEIETNGFFSIMPNRKLNVPLNGIRAMNGQGNRDPNLFIKIQNSLLVYNLDIKRATKILPAELDKVLYAKQFS